MAARMTPRLALIGTLMLGLLVPARAAGPAESFRPPPHEMASSAQRVGDGWSAADDVISQVTVVAAPQLLLLGNPDWDRYTIHAQVRFKDAAVGAEAGLVLQARDSANYVVFALAERRSGPYAVLRIENSEGSKLVGDQSPATGLDLSG